MSGQEDDADRPHDPSERRLQEAREKGEVARSADLTTAAATAAFVLVCLSVGPGALKQVGAAAATYLAEADRLGSQAMAGGATTAAAALSAFGPAIAPFFLVPAAAALFSVVAQQAFTFTPSRLAPKLSRISPIATLKHKFGLDGLVEFGKSTVKLMLVSAALGIWAVIRAPVLLDSLLLPPALAIATVLAEAVQFLLIVTALAIVVGGADYLWQWLSHRRRNRMTRQEVVEEHRNAEGDPHVQAQRRQRGQEIAMNRMLLDVPRADVVIVNPTHYAVALKWDRASGRAPVCVAKGVDEVAARIRARAAEAGVPLHRDPPTARLLHGAIDLGQEVHPDHYRAVAAAIRFAEAMRKRAGRRVP